MNNGTTATHESLFFALPHPRSVDQKRSTEVLSKERDMQYDIDLPTGASVTSHRRHRPLHKTYDVSGEPPAPHPGSSSMLNQAEQTPLLETAQTQCAQWNDHLDSAHGPLSSQLFMSSINPSVVVELGPACLPISPNRRPATVASRPVGRYTMAERCTHLT